MIEHNLRLILLAALAMLIVVESSILAETAAKCTERTRVGIGYNIILGNPNGDIHSLAGRDPGLRYSRQILKVTYDDGRTKKIKGTKYCVPDQGITKVINSCLKTKKTYFYSGTKSYQNTISNRVTIDGKYGYGFGLAEYRFSGSSEYQSVQAASESQEQVFIDENSYCHESKSRYEIDKIPEKENYGVDESFYYSFKRLPDTKSPSDSQLRAYYNFLDDWGTHIVDESTLGGRKVKRYRSSLSKLFEYAQENKKNAISLGGSYNGVKTSVSLNMDAFSASSRSASEFTSTFASYDTTITVGSTISKKGTIPSNDEATPEPITLKLISIAYVCKDNGYWSTIENLKGNTVIGKFLKNRCQNLKDALGSYAAYKGVSLPTEVSLPVTWPDGAYGLLKPTSGCPQNTPGFSFQSGWRRQSNKNWKHKWSKNNHFSGIWRNKCVTYRFCMKNVEQANTEVRYSWPKGQYCIFKKTGSSCPAGFKKGYIYWKNWKSSGEGSVPDGFYGPKCTGINYCCREDGNTRESIYLPNTEPFYLIRKGDNCQEVEGMTVTEESLAIAGTNRKTIDDYPFVSRSNRCYTLYYCYYKPSSARTSSVADMQLLSEKLNDDELTLNSEYEEYEEPLSETLDDDEFALNSEYEEYEEYEEPLSETLEDDDDEPHLELSI